MSGKIAQTYVWHEGQCYFVSTINRESSAMLAPGVYSETMAWEYDYDNRQRGELIFEGSHVRNGVRLHQTTVENLRRSGKPEKEES